MIPDEKVVITISHFGYVKELHYQNIVFKIGEELVIGEFLREMMILLNIFLLLLIIIICYFLLKQVNVFG